MLRGRPEQAIVPATDLPRPARVRSPHPRATGGFDKGRAWRWTPLLEARSPGGRWRGAPATLLVHTDGPFKRGIWAAFGIDDPGWYASPQARQALASLLQRMRHGVFLLEGGTNHYTYFDGQDAAVGLRAANLAKEPRPGIRARVRIEDTVFGEAAVRAEWSLSPAAGDVQTFAEPWRPSHWPPEGFRAVAELVENGTVIDRIVHEVNVWRPKPEKRFITIADGDFRLDGRRWRANGVNYMPSSGIGFEDYDYFEHWLNRRAYDPEVIERDLGRIRDLGLNAVSIFIDHVSIRAQNLVDLLRRLDRHGIRANVSLRPGTPMDFQWPKIRETIEHLRLGEHDTIFAYDLAWEPSFGTHEERRRWDADWQAWVDERYGGLENAEKDWAFRAPRTPDGRLTNPLPEQIDTDGPWRRTTAAYRRFLDTLLYRKYGDARRLVRGVAPNQFVSFRMSEAGNPTYRWGGRIAYDFPYLAAAVDFLAPEAYGRIGYWDNVRPGWFVYEYCRWAAPDKPMIWAEMGVSAWDLARMESSPKLLEFQGEFYRQFYRMLIASGSDGVFSWWYPGGFRWGENSDFGISNPDGTDRPASLAIRENAQPFLDGPDARPVDHWIEFDRDRHPDGIAGIYDAAKDEFWKAVDAGRAPGLRTAGTGTTSTDCPLVAVGNTPCNGSNPPKYLDGAFDLVEVRDAEGRWVGVPRGGRVKVRPDGPAVARVTATNLGEAAWIPPGPGGAPAAAVKGGVYVVAVGEAAVRTPLPARVPRLGEVRVDEVPLSRAGPKGPTRITLTFEAIGRARFGEKFTLTLAP